MKPLKIKNFQGFENSKNFQELSNKNEKDLKAKFSKIAIASTGKNEDSEVSPVAGRAPYFLIYENGNLVKTLKNPFAIGGGGAGFAVAKMLKDEGVELVAAGHYGENLIGALKEKGIKRIELYDMNVKEALEKAK